MKNNKLLLIPLLLFLSLRSISGINCGEATRNELLNIFGVLLFFVGLLIILPVTTLAWTHAYKKLKEQAVEVSQKS